MDQRGVLSALSPASYLPAILCGIVLLLSVGVGSAEDGAVQGKGQIDAKSFRCITEMTHVRQFYVDNLLGNLDSTLAVANSATGGTYPPGSVIRLVPTEAMVKRDKGFNAVTHDWEFFELDVSKDGTEIRKRGFAEVVNRFGEARWLKCQPSIGSSPTACPCLPEFSGPDYFAFFFSASIRSLAAGPDEAGFWPVISWPSAIV
jgi:hypothetical protein